MLHRLIFDTTDADSIAASANVGAYLRASDGTLLTHTGGALNVSFSTVTDLDIRDLDAAQDNVAISDGTNTLSINADGSINITDNGDSITVDATDLDIRDLSAAQDNVAISDGTDTLAINADGSINVVSAAVDSALSDTAVLASAVDVSVTATLGLALADRKYLTVYNNGNKMVYVGQSGVTTANGFPLPPGSLLDMRLGAAVALHAVAQSGTQEVRALELS